MYHKLFGSQYPLLIGNSVPKIAQQSEENIRITAIITIAKTRNR